MQPHPRGVIPDWVCPVIPGVNSECPCIPRSPFSFTALSVLSPNSTSSASPYPNPTSESLLEGNILISFTATETLGSNYEDEVRQKLKPSLLHPGDEKQAAAVSAAAPGTVVVSDTHFSIRTAQHCGLGSLTSAVSKTTSHEKWRQPSKGGWGRALGFIFSPIGAQGKGNPNTSLMWRRGQPLPVWQFFPVTCVTPPAEQHRVLWAGK